NVEGTVGVAGDYSGTSMTLGNLDAFEYVLLVGGDATIGSGQQSASYSGGKESVDGNITYTGGTVLYNDVHAGGSVSAAGGSTSIDGGLYAASTITEDGGTFAITGTQNPNTPYTAPVNFTTISNYFKDVSDTVGALTNTGSVTDSYGALSITVVSGDNVTSIDATTLSDAYGFTVSGPSDAILYINVTGSTAPSMASGTNWAYNDGIDKSTVLLNFPTAATLTIENNNLINILAPYAAVSAPNGGWTQGSLVVGTMLHDINIRLGHFIPTPLSGGGPVLDHFVISHDGAGIYCASETILVTPKQANGSDFFGYTGTLVLNTQSSTGSWTATSGNGSLLDAVADDGLATYAFSGSESYPVTFTLDYQTDAAETINIDVYDSGDTLIRDDDSEGNITYVASGFTVTGSELVDPSSAVDIASQTAGTAFDMHITAFGTTPTSPECGIIETYTGDKSLDFWFSRVDPATGTIAPTIGGSAITATEDETPLTVTFTAGKAVVSAKYKDVGQISIDMKDVVIAGTSQFVVKPADFELSAIKMPAVAGTCNVTDSEMKIVTLDPHDETIVQIFTAGEKFCVTVTVKDSEGDTTPNFGNEAVAETIKLTSTIVASGGVNNPAITTGATGFDFAASDGVVTSAEVSWSEVGIIKLHASVDGADYLGAGDVTGGFSDDIGRFIPADFSVVNSQVPQLQTLCNTGGFSYVGDSINYVQKPGFTVTARNINGVTTQNYTGTWAKLTATDAIPDPIYDDLEWGAPSTDLVGTDDPTIGDASGVITLNFNAVDALTFTRADPTNNVDAAISFSITLQDADGVEATVNPHVINSISFDAGADIRYGRMRIGDARQSELLSLGLPVVMEYYSNGFITNSDDTCTQNITFAVTDGNSDDNLAPGDTCIYEAPLDLAGIGDSGIACDTVAPTNRSYSEPPVAGSLNLWFRPPGGNKTGPLNVSATVPYWLKYNWDGAVGDDNPQGRIYFGGYRGERKFIFLREAFR
ncbi:MAG: choice-of-anchor A family protein, partial [Candidatus Polarisedimenticolaceae bacterium]|nr:choice-of-anchor A family protein [Candidatus Polarisedimenticolaceae bacterium]